MSTRNQKPPRRDLLDVIGRRMARLTPDQAAVAWAELARRVGALGEVDLPKFKHLVEAIRAGTIAGKQLPDTADNLRCDWSDEEADLMMHFPLGSQTKCDAGYLTSVLSKEVTAELTRRGYDVRTIKFSIAPAKGNERFASQRKEAKA